MRHKNKIHVISLIIQHTYAEQKIVFPFQIQHKLLQNNFIVEFTSHCQLKQDPLKIHERL
jgi:hypothetical protein